MRLEDPRTYECWPSYETIGKAIGKSKSSVKRYVAGLVEKGLITVEPTSVTMRNGLKKKRQPALSHSPHPRSGGVVHAASAVPRRSRRRATSGTVETVGASRRTAAIRPGEPLCGLAGRSKCHRTLGVGESGASRLRRDGKFRVCGTVFDPWPKPLPKRACGLSPHPFSWRSNV